jgi:hypothetical protein
MPRARLAVLAAVLLTAAAAPVADAARVRCGSGTPMFQHGSLRIFGVAVHYPEDAEWRGYEEYACAGAKARPIEVGSTGTSEGTASGDTPRYVYDGSRYLAREEYSDGEGGPDATYWVTDLRTRHTVTFANAVAWEPGTSPPLRLTTRGDLLTTTRGDVQLIRRGLNDAPGRTTTLWASGEMAEADDVALVGTTAYWTQRPDAGAPTVGSATVANAADAPEARLFEPVRIRPDRSRCASRPGKTTARSTRVRVLERGTSRWACRAGSAKVARLPGGALRDLRIAGDRWVLSVGAATATATDMSTRTRRTLGEARAWTLLADGTVAWIAADGSLLARGARAAAPTVLATAAEAPTALASSGGTIYWTAGGVAHRADG